MKAAKAIFATVATAIGAILTSITGSETLSSLTTSQWLAVILSALVAGGGVYGITNRTTP